MTIAEIIEIAQYHQIIDHNWIYDWIQRTLTYNEFCYHFYVNNNEDVRAIGISFKNEPDIECIYRRGNDGDTWIQWVFSEKVRQTFTNYWYTQHGFYFEDGRVYGSENISEVSDSRGTI